jgi:hypothetical protein
VDDRPDETPAGVRQYMSEIAARGAQVRRVQAIERRLAEVGPVPAELRDRLRDAVDGLEVVEDGAA